MADNQTRNPSLPGGFLAGAEGEIIKSKTPKMAGQTAADMAEQAGVGQGDVMAEQAANPDLNPDAVVGNILTRAAQKPGPEQMSSTSSESKAATETVGANIDSATERATGTPTATPSEEQSKVTLSAQSQAAYDRSFELLDSMAATAEADRKTAIEDIQKQRDLSVADTQQAQRMESGAASKSLARIGAYGGTGSGIAYAKSLASSHRIEAESIKAKWAEAIEKAKAAYDEKDIDLANQLMNTANGYETQLNNARITAMNEAKTAIELTKFERESDLTTLNAWAEEGYSVDDIPDGMFQEMDKNGKYVPGTSKGLFALAENNKKIKDITDVQEIKAKEMQMATSLQNILKQVPAGQPVEIGGYTYFGTSGLGDIEVDETTGEASVFTVGADGEITQKYIGNVGATKDGWATVMIGGEPFRLNERTGEYRSFLGPKADLNEIIPVGKYDAMPGKEDAFPNLPLQCGEFTSTLTGQSVGNTLDEKIAKINVEDVNSIVEGNTLVFGGSSTGHVAVVNSVYTTLDHRLKFVLSEANWKSPGEVTHDREVYADDPSLKGAIDSRFKPEYMTGSDSGRLEAAIARENAPKLSAAAAVAQIDFGNADVQSAASTAFALGKNKDARAASAKDIEREWNRSQATNDPKYVREEIERKILQGSYADDQKGYTTRQAVKDGMRNALDMIDQLENEGTDIDFMNGTIEEIYNKLGQTSDPKLKRLKTYLTPFLMEYRRSQTGVAFSEREDQQYKDLFPGIKQNPETFRANVAGLVDSLDSYDRSYMKTKLGNTTYENLFVNNPLDQATGAAETGNGNETASEVFTGLTQSDITFYQNQGYTVTKGEGDTYTISQ